jgi:hypothetical protein
MCKTQLSKSNYLQRSVEKRDKQDCEWLPTVQQEDSSDDSQIAVRKRRGVKRPWTIEENAAIERQLGIHIVKKVLPGKKLIEECRHKETVLATRTWKNIKDIIRHKIKSKQNHYLKRMFIE